MRNGQFIPEIFILVLEHLSFRDITNAGFVCRGWKGLALNLRWSISWVPVCAALSQLAPLKADSNVPIWHLDATEDTISKAKFERWIQTIHKVKRLALKKLVMSLTSVDLIYRLLDKYETPYPWFNLQSVDLVWNILLFVPTNLPPTVPDTQNFEYAMLLGGTRTSIKHIILEVEPIRLAPDPWNYQLVFRSVRLEPFTQLDTLTFVTPFPDIQSAIFSGCPSLRRLELVMKECRRRLRHIQSTSVLPRLKELLIEVPEGGLAIDVLDSCRIPEIEAVWVTCPPIDDTLRESIIKRVGGHNEEAVTVFSEA